MSTLLDEIHYIHECLNLICKAESELLDTSFFGIFKKKNYIGIHNTLDVSSSKLAELFSSVDTYRGNSKSVDAVVNDAQNFIRALLSSTEKLVEINQALSQKALGKSYAMHSYNSDLNEFKFLQDQYCSIGDRMNANYRLYSHEIAQAKPQPKVSVQDDKFKKIYLKTEGYESQISNVMPVIEFESMQVPLNNGNDGSSKLLIPSVALSVVVGSAPLPRTEVVSKLWVYIKKNNLQDQTNKRNINTDSNLREIFGRPQVTMFELASLINKHLK